MSSDDKKKIEAVVIMEVLGRPAEYLTETLNNLIKQIGEEKGIFIKRTDVKPPVEMHEQKGFYTSFAEIEIEAEEMMYIAVLLFKYMPAHVEIISPQNLSLSNTNWNDILNEITRRLHGYEEVVRMIQSEKMILENKLKSLGVSNQPAVMPKEKPKKSKKEKKND